LTSSKATQTTVKKIRGKNWKEKNEYRKRNEKEKKRKKDIYFTVHVNSKIDGMQPIYFSIQ
jgi:hypothetical protein